MSAVDCPACGHWRGAHDRYGCRALGCRECSPEKRLRDAEAERDRLAETLRLRSEALDRVVAENERLTALLGEAEQVAAIYEAEAGEADERLRLLNEARAKVARVEALALRLAQIHNRLHGDVEINRQEHRRGERDQIRRVHDDLRAALEGDR